jgi:small ligand-binding sensory domain FIST
VRAVKRSSDHLALPGRGFRFRESATSYTRSVDRTGIACWIGAGLSTESSVAEAVREAAGVAGGVAGPVDLAFLFLSQEHADAVEVAAETVHDALSPAHLAGCVAEGVIAGGREVEAGPAAAVWAASLPGAELEPFHAVAIDTGRGTVVAGFPEGDAALVTMLADPFSFPAASFLSRLHDHRPGLPVIGGLAVGGDGAETTALLLEDEVYDEGAVGVSIAGVPIVTVVSQGCAPFGRESVVTSADGSTVYELAGEPALTRLRSELEKLSPEEQQLAARGILAGLVIDENRSEYGRGDFLMRAILGADEASGALTLADRVRVGQTVRFHIRDGQTADDDLRESLGSSLSGVTPAGALLFSCNGRGTRMFAEPDHDVALVAGAVGGDAVAGFFCGGEIGPVGGRSFVHAFTATLAVFLTG